MSLEPVHNLVRVSVVYPRLCLICDDYIVTPRCTARQCITCGSLFHASCVTKAGRCHGSVSSAAVAVSAGVSESIGTDAEASAGVALSDQPLANWSVEQVLQWLVVVGLSRYTALFFSYSINGEALPGLLKPLSPLNDINDSFARCTLKRAIMTLVGELPSPSDRTFIASQVSSPTPHVNLRLQNFTCELACCVCGLPLLGLVYQGYHCSACGSVFHRICRVFTEVHPPCPGRLLVDAQPSRLIGLDSPPPDSDLQQSGSTLPTASAICRHTYFTVPLEEQITDADEVPIFLSTATRIFEQLATFNAQEITKLRPPQQSLSSLPSSSPLLSAPSLPMVNCVDVYRVSATGRELQDLEWTYADCLPTDLETASSIPAEQRLVRLAQIIKRFLAQLPEPVIPAEMYQRTLDLAAGSDSSINVNNTNDDGNRPSNPDDISDLEVFLSSLPPRNLATLRHIMQHVGFILCHQRLLKVRLSVGQQQKYHLPGITNNGNIDRLDDPRLVLSILAHVLIRPTWQRVVLLASPVGEHRRLVALERLFEYFTRRPGTAGAGGRLRNRSARSIKSYECYAELLAQSGGSSILSLVPSSSAVTVAEPGASPQWDPPTARSVERNRRDLATRDWYWDDVSRSEVSGIMRGHPDGAFLLRDSTSTTNSPFTLTERRNDNIIHFRIYHRGDVFDITNPPSPGFALVSALVAHYQQQAPLTSIDAPIPRLLFPVVRNSLGLPPLPLSASSDCIMTCLLSALRSAAVELNHLQLKVDELNCQSSKFMHQLSVTTNQMQALGRAQEWLVKTNSQFARNKKFAKPASQEVLERHTSLWKQRLNWATAARLAKRKQHNSLLDQIREVCESLVVIYSQKLQVTDRMQEIRRELKRRGVSDEVILACDLGPTDALLSPLMTAATDVGEMGVNPSSSVLASLPPLERSTWFAEVSRHQAEEVLSNKPSGTFLIRPSAMADRFALSVKAGNAVQHCLIYAGRVGDSSDDGGSRWGFSEKALLFSSLDELVAYYRATSLVQHNALLDTSLIFPAFALPPTSPSQKTPTKGVTLN